MTGDPLKIAIAGIGGRMGREILRIARQDVSVLVTAGIVRPGGETGADDSIPLVTSIADLPDGIDVIIDFSTATATVTLARAAAERSIPIVIGTTGLTNDDLAALKALSGSIPIWYARNMSYGVSVLHDVLRRMVTDLRDYDIELVELHHRNKIDAPSGTALALAETIQRGRDVGESEITVGRSGSGKRESNEIGIQSIRGGGNAGEHTVIFASDDEEVRISHRALSRSAFASGAIRAAKRIAAASPGWYSQD